MTSPYYERGQGRIDSDGVVRAGPDREVVLPRHVLDLFGLAAGMRVFIRVYMDPPDGTENRVVLVPLADDKRDGV